jgi:hypothetical protein
VDHKTQKDKHPFRVFIYKNNRREIIGMVFFNEKVHCGHKIQKDKYPFRVFNYKTTGDKHL